MTGGQGIFAPKAKRGTYRSANNLSCVVRTTLSQESTDKDNKVGDVGVLRPRATKAGVSLPAMIHIHLRIHIHICCEEMHQKQRDARQREQGVWNIAYHYPPIIPPCEDQKPGMRWGLEIIICHLSMYTSEFTS